MNARQIMVLIQGDFNIFRMQDWIKRFRTSQSHSDFRSEHLLSLRSRLLHIILTHCVPAISLALGIFTVDSFRRESLIQAIVYMLIFIVYLSAAIARSMQYPRRATLLMLTMYIYGLGELLWNGTSGDGRLVMLTLTGFSMLFLGLRPGLFFFGLTLFTQVVLGVAMPLGWIAMPAHAGVRYSSSMLEWQTGNIIYLACGGALLYTMVFLFEKLETSLDGQHKLTRELEEERNSLQVRIEEQTADMRREIAERIQKEADLRNTEQQLRYISNHDTLTGMHNRAYYEDQLILLNQGGAYPLSVIMADVDNLKLINDQNGHAAGDCILKATAEVLRASFRKQDTIARIGGDEFVILLPDTDELVVCEMLERVKSAIQAHPLKARYAAPFSISLGYATAQNAGLLQDALHTADLLMYFSKQNERACKTRSGSTTRS